MKNWKKRIGSLLMAAALTVGLSTAALADTTASAIGVELDGQPVAFTDAVPQVKDQRTFLPFRAVFEALGATVEWHPDTYSVSAVRGDTSVSMVIGATEATVTENGVSYSMEMDVAAYAENGRTYVPVRFAAQALGCTVGWDQDDQTVILVDTDKLLKETVANQQFTYLERALTYGDRYSEGTWKLDADLLGVVTMQGLHYMSVEGTADAIVGDGNAQMDLDMTMDLTTYMELMAQFYGVSLENLLALNGLTKEALTEEMGVSLRVDGKEQVVYMQLAGMEPELPADTWLSMNMSDAMADSGMDAEQMEKLSGQELTIADLLEILYAMSAVEPTDKDTAYETVSAALNGLAAGLCDQAFQESEDGHSTEWMDVGPLGISVEVYENAHGETVGCAISVDLYLPVEVLGETELEGQEEGMEYFYVMLDLCQEEDGALAAWITLDMGGLMGVELELAGKYTPTAQGPQTKPPAGAQVMDYEEWVASQTETVVR